FFSSRRRHTRSKRDWSSDVCSSDLFFFLFDLNAIGRDHRGLIQTRVLILEVVRTQIVGVRFFQERMQAMDRRKDIMGVRRFADRSEERRVGKECSSGYKWLSDKR